MARVAGEVACLEFPFLNMTAQKGKIIGGSWLKYFFAYNPSIESM